VIQATEQQKKLGFRIHALTFVPGVIALVVINLLTGPPYWCLYAVPAWSIGLFSHWFFVLGPGARNAGMS
jgi:hypothetical protein